MTLKDEIEDVQRAADFLEQGIFGMIGLGVVQTTGDGDSAIEELNNAYAALDAQSLGAAHVAAARGAVLRGERALELAVQSRSFLWRWWNIHQLGLFLYHLVFLFVLLAIGTACFIKPKWCVLPDAILDKRIPLVVLAMAGLGAELRALWFLPRQIGARLYRRRFLLGHLVAPFTGVLLGILTFLVARAGLLIIGGTTAATGKATASELALCFFAGFKWEWAVRRIQGILEQESNGGTSKNDSEEQPVKKAEGKKQEPSTEEPLKDGQKQEGRKQDDQKQSVQKDESPSPVTRTDGEHQ